MRKKSVSSSMLLIVLTSLSIFGSHLLMAQTAKAKKEGKVHLAMPAYEKYIDEKTDAHLKEFIELVSIPSISSMPSHKADVQKTAEWIVRKLQTIGMTTAQTIATEGNPVVFGSWDKAPGKPTVLIYAHYDIQPVKDAEWDIPPFAPKLVDGKIMGRGASDDKSGVMIPIWAIETLLSKDGKLPVNVKLIFEGEEEMGSIHFNQFLTANKELLKADFALNADGGQENDNDPSIVMSLRGATTMEFTAKTADLDGHSGEYGGKTPNAVVALSQIIASLFNKEGNVAVEGFYDKVIPLTAAEKIKLKKVPYNPTKDMKYLGTTAEVGDTNYLPLERTWYRPTLEITGMQGGYTAAEGSSNIIPGKAFARITCRLVENQNGAEINELIIKHIKKYCPVGVTLSFKPSGHFARPMKFPSNTKAFTYVANALNYYYGKQPLETATGGSVGALTNIREQLGLYAYSLGFQQPDEKWHGANEFLRVSSIRKGQLIYCYYLAQLAEEENNKK